MHLTWTSLTVVAATALAVAKASPTGFVSCMQNIKGNAKSKLVISSSNTYNTDRYGFNLLFDYKPVAIYYPATSTDAAEAIKCAATNNINVAPRSGGHSFEGYCEGGKDGALVIDLVLLQDFSLDPTTNVASIGAGSRLGTLYGKLWNAGQFLIAAGTCPSVGIGGHTLGGGLGMVGRKYGMASDNVVGMTFVDPKGNILQVSASSNPDLFWALRGAGAGSFGLVTEFQIQAYKAPPVVTTMLINFPLTKYSVIMDAYGELGATATDDLMAEMNLGGKNIQVQVNFLGPKTGADAALATFLQRTGPPSSQEVKEGTWYDAAMQWSWMEDGGTLEKPIVGDNRYARGRSLVYRKPMSKKEKDILYKYLSKPPKGSSSAYIIVDIWGGKVNRPNAPSAFDNHRGVLYGIEFISEWGDHLSKPGVKCPNCLKWSANFAKEMQAAYSSGPIEAYQNYIERDLPNSLQAYYGNNLDRLKKIKRDIDPKNVFSYAQSIPLK